MAPAVQAHDDVAQKLSAARTQLIVERPFFGVLVLHLPLIAADPAWCATLATDTQAIYYNRGYVERLTLEQTKFVLAHEALHCALAHFERRQHRERRRWDAACDFAVNSILVGDGLIAPPDALRRKAFDGMSAEEIYPFLKERGEESFDRHLYDDADPAEFALERPPPGGGASAASGAPTAGGGRGDRHAAERGAAVPPRLGASERARSASQCQLRLASAALQALRAGRLSAGLARLIDDLLQPQLPWRMLLARYLTSYARTDYSFARASRREGAAILPGLRAAQVEIAVVIDTSGSIEAHEMREFLSEVDAIKGHVNTRITLHACDAALDPAGPWVYEPWEPLKLPTHLRGGGGTRFTPAFDWAERLEPAPDVVIYFTDALGEFPPREPAVPVLWLVKGKAPVPWGQRIQLN